MISQLPASSSCFQISATITPDWALTGTSPVVSIVPAQNAVPPKSTPASMKQGPSEAIEFASTVNAIWSPVM